MKNYFIFLFGLTIALFTYFLFLDYRNEVHSLAAKVQRMDSVIQAQNDIIKDLRTDQYYINKDLDYVFPVVTKADSFLLKESGRGKNWRKVGRASGYIIQGIRDVL